MQGFVKYSEVSNHNPNLVLPQLVKTFKILNYKSYFNSPPIISKRWRRYKREIKKIYKIFCKNLLWTWTFPETLTCMRKSIYVTSLAKLHSMRSTSLPLILQPYSSNIFKIFNNKILFKQAFKHI